MPYLQVDDQLPVNLKIRTLIERSMLGELEGLAAMGLWTLAGADAQASLSDGVVRRTDLTRILLNPQLVDDLAARLVNAGLWHPPGHLCDRCPPVDDDSWLFHDWFQFGYDTGEQVKATRARRKELKDRKVIDAVWARDCIDPAVPTIAKCRYCGVELNRHDRKSEHKPAAWPDHVDPAKAKGVRNLVVSCDGCQRRKGQRTPAQAGMRLLPPPRPCQEDPTVVLAAPAAQQRPSTADTARREAVRPADADTARPAERPVVEGNARAAGSDQARPVPDQTRDQMDRDLIPGGSARARDRARAGQGSGIGSRQGDGQGQREGQPRSASGRRRRGRRRSRSGAPAGPPPVTSSPAPAGPQWDAGVAPEVDAPGRFGSPWHGWRGAPPDEQTLEESTCAEHGLPLPCRKCVPQWLRDEGWIP